MGNFILKMMDYKAIVNYRNTDMMFYIRECSGFSVCLVVCLLFAVFRGDAVSTEGTSRFLSLLNL